MLENIGDIDIMQRLDGIDLNYHEDAQRFAAFHLSRHQKSHNIGKQTLDTCENKTKTASSRETSFSIQKT
jgi:hypothetical protein